MDYPPPLAPKPAMVAKATYEYPPPRILVKSTVTSKVKDNGQHVHKCPSCSTEWSHSDNNVNNRAAHTCPNPECGKLLPPGWAKSEHNKAIVQTTKVESVPVAKAQQSQAVVNELMTPTMNVFGNETCPGGNCPTSTSTSTRRGLFGWRR